MLHDLLKRFGVSPYEAICKACRELEFTEPMMLAEYVHTEWKEKGFLPTAIEDWIREHYYGESDCNKGGSVKSDG